MKYQKINEINNDQNTKTQRFTKNVTKQETGKHKVSTRKIKYSVYLHVQRVNDRKIVKINRSNSVRQSLNGLSGDHSKQVPPDPMPNSEVKLLSADGSVALAM